MNDRQLGQMLAAALPKRTSIDSKQVLAVLHDLLEKNDPRMAPLEKMVRRPEFLLFASRQQVSHALLQRDILLNVLGETHSAEVVDRLGIVLDGWLRQTGLSSPQESDSLFSDQSSDSPIFSNQVWERHWQSFQQASIPQPSDLTPWRDRLTWGLMGAVTLVILSAVSLGVLRGNWFCSSYGVCSVASIKITITALEEAQKASEHLDNARDIKGYKHALKILEDQLQRVTTNVVLSQVQRDNLQDLQTKKREAHRRLKREKKEQQILRQVSNTRAMIPRLNPRRAQQTRLRLLRQLEQISSNSFSHRQAETLRQDLQSLQLLPLPRSRLLPIQSPPPQTQAATRAFHSSPQTPPIATTLKPPPTQRIAPAKPELLKGEHNSVQAPLRDDPIW
ncbi:MAG: hypothetical protein ACK6AD_07840 [Cyanobacteriota bacterium]|jgi:hypothetical protein